MSTRAECQAQAEAAVKKWADAFGISGAWVFKTVLGPPDKHESLEGNAAAVDRHHHHQVADVYIHERCKPERYDQKAAHETLHVLFAPVERAIAQLTEPAKTVVDDAMHSAIHRLAHVLAGTTQGADDNDGLGERPPWEPEA